MTGNCFERNAQVFDLGELQVRGDIRRPLIAYVNSNFRIKEQIEKIALEKLDEYEAYVLDFKNDENMSEIK